MTLPVTVSRLVTTSSATTFQCGRSAGDCVIMAFGITEPFGIGYATAPITFAPPTPRSKQDCKKGGWRNVADAQGHPFSDQGDCIDFVVSHPK